MAKVYQNNIAKLFEQWSGLYLSEHEVMLSFVPEQVHDQVEFIGNYLVAILMELPNKHHLAWAEQFFSLQKAGLDEDNLEFQFSGDMSDTLLLVRDVSEIDLSVVHGLTEFGTIAINRGDGNKWSKKDVQTLLNVIRSDLEFDFDSVTLSHKTKGSVLEINCQIEGKE